MFKTIALVLSAMGLINARITPGRCPKETDTMPNFDQAKYVGNWYEIRRDFWNPFTFMADCVTKEFKENDDGNVDLNFRGSYPMAGYGNGSGVLYDCPIGDCKATMGRQKRERAADFDIFYTDYDNFEISYFCWDWGTIFGAWSFEYLSISSREPTMSDEVMKKAQKVIADELPWYYDYFFNKSQSYGMF